MKKSLKVSLVLMLILGGMIYITGCSKTRNLVESFPKKVTELDSYILDAKLESMFPTGSKECMVKTYYQKPDLYRVEIESSNVQDKQIIIKNKDGVFVLIPSINKNFKIKSTWPINSSYPYLLQSLSKDIVNDENITISKTDKTTTLELKAKIFDNIDSVQKIIFDNETGFPKEVLTYDSNKNLISRLLITNIDFNPKLDDKLFHMEKTMESIRLDYNEMPITFKREITYPTYYPVGTALKEEVIRGGTLNKRALMNFTGEASYTIIQEYLNATDVVQTTYLDGDIYIMGGTVSIVGKDIITFYDNGIEYTIASSTVNILEMVKMGESLRVDIEK